MTAEEALKRRDGVSQHLPDVAYHPSAFPSLGESSSGYSSAAGSTNASGSRDRTRLDNVIET